MTIHTHRFFSLMLSTLLVLALSLTPVSTSHAAMSSTAKTTLNSAALSPKTTGDETLDQLISDRLSQIMTADMTQYDQVKAIYDYLIGSFYHDDNGTSGYTFDTTSNDLQTYLTNLSAKSWMYYTIYGFLNFNHGDCYGYSFTFTAMARALGFDAWVVMGKTSTTSGSYSNHAWSVIRIGGIDYVFDPDIDDMIAGTKATGYYRFCKPYSQVASKYRVYSNAESTQVYQNGTGDTSPLILNVEHSMADRLLAANGLEFDPEYYAATYPDVVATLGSDPAVLLNHYNTCGIAEKRHPNARQ